jgi:hypothetical protein
LAIFAAIRRALVATIKQNRLALNGVIVPRNGTQARAAFSG